MTPEEQGTYNVWAQSYKEALMLTELKQNSKWNQVTSMDKPAYIWLSLSLFTLYMLWIMSCNFFVATLCCVIIPSQKNPNQGQQVLQ